MPEPDEGWGLSHSIDKAFIMSDSLASRPAAPSAPAAASALVRLSPFVFIVFFGFLAIGLPLTALPLHAHGALGLGAVMVGVVIGLQSVATLLTRRHAGVLSDMRGPKRAVLRGLAISALAGLCYGLSTVVPTGVGLAVLLLGRVALGLGESLLITGALSWAIGVVGPQNSGKVMAWNGIAMYGALALGAPVGGALLSVKLPLLPLAPLVHGGGGFALVAVAAALAPLVGLLVAVFVPSVAPAAGVRMPFTAVMGTIARPGLGLALSSVGFTMLAAFAPLLFAARGWDGAGLALSAFGAAYIATRLVAGGLPDRLGGRRVAIGSLLVELVGQAVIATAATPDVAVVGAAITGLGFSLVFPSLGVEAVKRVPPQNRGVALGAYVAFFDLAIALSAPGAGLLVGAWGYASVFAAGAVAAALAALLTATDRAA